MSGRKYEEKVHTDETASGESVKNAERISALGGRRGRMDIPFLLITLILLAVGVMMVFSASFARAYYKYNDPTRFFIRQLIFSVSGLALMYAASRIRPEFYRHFSVPLLGFSILMLAAVLIPGIGTGKEEVGANRWINLGFTTFQPSELTKLAVILTFAAMICVYKEKMKTFKYGVLRFALVLGLIAGLLVLEPHLSATIIILAVGAIMMFAGGTPWGWFVGAIGVFAVGATTLVNYVKNMMLNDPDSVSKLGYSFQRIVSWIDPSFNASDTGWQITQSLYAIGSGGITGLGFGQGRQKYLYLPEEHNDFIFSIICEELGFIGAVLVILLFVLLIVRGFWLALHARDRFGSLVITGITSLIAIQVFLNIAVVTNLVPCTGVSLPFFSYGGTALWIQLVEVGIVLSISRDIPLQTDESDGEKGTEEEENK